MDTLIFIFQLVIAFISGLAGLAGLIQTIDNYGSLIKNKCLVFIYEDESVEDGYVQEALFWKDDKKRIISFLFFHGISVLCFVALFAFIISELFA